MSKVGRKKKYTPDMCQKAYKLAAKGLIDVDIAKRLGISPALFYQYQNEFLEFLESVKNGKKIVDDVVENMLLKRAKGYKYQEVEKTYDEGNTITKTKKITKQVPPDVNAITFWLRNRNPERWNERLTVEHSGAIGVKIIDDISAE